MVKHIFKIPVSWEVSSFIHIEAETLDEAILIFDKEETEGDGYSLPSDHEYIDGTFRREDEESCQLNNED